MNQNTLKIALLAVVAVAVLTTVSGSSTEPPTTCTLCLPRVVQCENIGMQVSDQFCGSEDRVACCRSIYERCFECNDGGNDPLYYTYWDEYLPGQSCVANGPCF